VAPARASWLGTSSNAKIRTSSARGPAISAAPEQRLIERVEHPMFKPPRKTIQSIIINRRLEEFCATGAQVITIELPRRSAGSTIRLEAQRRVTASPEGQ
jgi:hypothetical protein